MVTGKAARLEEFLRRLKSEAPSPSYEAAKALIDSTLNAVEDELSGIPNSPATYATDGRMYPVQEDNVRRVPRQPNIRRLRSLGHDTFIGENGAFRIVERSSKRIEVDKPGEDGQRLPEDL